jgi:arsenate reductase (thioredoxin)
MVPPGGIRGNRPRLRGDSVLRPRTPAPAGPARKKSVLFVCIGNSCRSQMAEGFARAYGSDIVIASSAGLAPATIIAPLTRQIMQERNVRLDGHFPKPLHIAGREPFDLIVNMSGHPLPPGTSGRVVDWPVPDPIGKTQEFYRSVAARIEALVMRLILDLRTSG